MIRRIDAGTLRAWLGDGRELALLDVREQGVHYQGHPFFACSLPLSRLELMVADLVPRRSVRAVLVDGGRGDTLAARAGEVLDRLGYDDLFVLDGGCAAWAESGGELFSGVNVPSKAFGEFVEHHFDTPRMPPDELRRLVDAGRKVVILDSRPYAEYHRMNIPGGIDVPGAELAYRVHDLAPDPETLVVVNCAGRTRSIIGCQSLRNAGIPNEVVALKDGTMGWDLAGFECERGATRVAPPPSPAGREKARAAAKRVAARFGVRFVERDLAQRWLADPARTTFLLDVRTAEEFEQRHIDGSCHAPGGQVVQATDEYVGVRNARVILIDPARVRSVMTASWLNQMGWDDVHVLEPAGDDGFDGWVTREGTRRKPVAGTVPDWPAIDADGLAARLGGGGTTVIDLATSLRHRDRHVPGAWWAVRARLDEARAKVADGGTLVLTSEDGVLAALTASEAAALWEGSQVLVLSGGSQAWFERRLPTESGLERMTTRADDVWYKPYDHAKDYEKYAREYLTWEIALVDQIRRDPTIRFRSYD